MVAIASAPLVPPVVVADGVALGGGGQDLARIARAGPYRRYRTAGSVIDFR
jgi:hypothetical protein